MIAESPSSASNYHNSDDQEYDSKRISSTKPQPQQHVPSTPTSTTKKTKTPTTTNAKSTTTTTTTTSTTATMIRLMFVIVIMLMFATFVPIMPVVLHAITTSQQQSSQMVDKPTLVFGANPFQYLVDSTSTTATTTATTSYDSKNQQDPLQQNSQQEKQLSSSSFHIRTRTAAKIDATAPSLPVTTTSDDKTQTDTTIIKTTVSSDTIPITDSTPTATTNSSSSSIRTMYLHIGPAKTGTTFLQCALSLPGLYTNLLLQDNIQYVGRCSCRSKTPSNETRQILDDAGLTGDSWKKDCLFLADGSIMESKPGIDHAVLKGNVRKVLNTALRNDRDALIMNEFLAPMSQTAIRRLVTELKTPNNDGHKFDRVVVMLSYRRLLDWLPSYFTQMQNYGNWFKRWKEPSGGQQAYLRHPFDWYNQTQRQRILPHTYTNYNRIVNAMESTYAAAKAGDAATSETEAVGVNSPQNFHQLIQTQSSHPFELYKHYWFPNVDSVTVLDYHEYHDDVKVSPSTAAAQSSGVNNVATSTTAAASTDPPPIISPLIMNLLCSTKSISISSNSVDTTNPSSSSNSVMAKDTCHKLLQNELPIPGNKLNERFDIHYDLVATGAHAANLIGNPTAIGREEAVKRISKRVRKGDDNIVWPITNCMSQTSLETFFNHSERGEYAFLRTLTNDQQQQHQQTQQQHQQTQQDRRLQIHRDAFDSFITKRRHCSINVSAVLEDPDWISFFQSMK